MTQTLRTRISQRIEYDRGRLLRRLFTSKGATDAQAINPLGVRELNPAHVDGCQMVANREILIREHLPKHGVVAEVGVQQGLNARTILEGAQPRELHLIDLTFSALDEQQIEPGLGDGTVRLHAGDSADVLASFPDEYFDWIYIDGNHFYSGVKRDIEQAKRKVKREGLLVFNDYITFSHAEFVFYGIVPAVNELCVTEGWGFRYFALAPHMYCDVALARLTA
jgi:hypothetical protein